MPLRPLPVFLALLAVAGSAPWSPAIAQASPAVGTCPGTVERTELMHDEQGNLLMFSHNHLATHDGEVMITGENSAAFALAGDGKPTLVHEDSLLALLRLRDGRVRAFARPDIGDWLLRFVTATPLGDGTWGLLLLTGREVPGRVILAPGPTWFMVVSARGVHSVQQLQMPDDVAPETRSDPAVARRGRRVVYATPARRLATDERGFLLLERTAGRWSTRYFATGGAAYVAPVFDGASGELVVAVVRAETNSVRLEDSNSLFLMRPDRPESRLELAAVGGDAPIHRPQLAATRGGFAIAWFRILPRTVRRAHFPAYFSMVEQGAVLDSRHPDGDVLRVAAVAGPDSTGLILLARSADDNVDDGATELDIVSPNSRDRTVRLRMPTAVDGAVLAAWNGKQLVVSYPRPLGGGTHVASELAYIQPRCSAPDGG